MAGITPPIHPPAMGGKTAWGVSEIVSCAGDDPAELAKMKKKAEEFNMRENDRLNRLKEMDKQGLSILEARRQRLSGFEMGTINGSDEFKKKQDEILAKMLEMKRLKRAERKAKREAEGHPKKKKKEEGSSSSSSSASSDSSASSSSSSSEQEEAPKMSKKERKKAEAEAKRKAEEDAKEELAAKVRAEEAKAREREVKRRAKAELAMWQAETRRKEAEEAAKKKAEEKRKREEALAKEKEEAKRKAEEAEAKKAQEEEEAKKKKADAEARKALFMTDSLKRAREADAKRKADIGKKARQGLAGGYQPRQAVTAAQDITIRGNLVVLAGTAGTIIGPAATDPVNRLAVEFVKRQDGLSGCINAVPRELKRG